MRHHAVGPHYRAVADGHPWQHRSPDAYPHIVFNDDGAAVGGAPVGRVGVVVDGNQVYLWGYEHAVAERYAPAVEERAALLNPAVLAYSDVFAIVDIEWREQRYARVNLAPGDALEV